MLHSSKSFLYKTKVVMIMMISMIMMIMIMKYIDMDRTFMIARIIPFTTTVYDRSLAHFAFVHFGISYG